MFKRVSPCGVLLKHLREQKRTEFSLGTLDFLRIESETMDLAISSRPAPPRLKMADAPARTLTVQIHRHRCPKPVPAGV
jgi:hypothetical protein